MVKAIIYGTDANAISVANALKFETPSRFKIVAFVDKNNQNASKRMLDLPILVQKEKDSGIDAFRRGRGIGDCG